MKVKDIMRKKFFALDGDDTLKFVVKKFAKNNVTSAPVLEEGEFRGVVSERHLVKYFTPKKFLFLWKKDKPTPVEKIEKILAMDLAGKPPVTLHPENRLYDVLGKIADRVECIPVLDKGKLVGIVRSEDILDIFLKEFAKQKYTSGLKSAKKDAASIMETELDNILDRVNSEGKVYAKDIAKEFGLSVATVEKLAESLHSHHLIDVKYSFFKSMELRRRKK